MKIKRIIAQNYKTYKELDLDLRVRDDNLISNQLNKKTQYRVAQKEIEPGWYLQTLSSTDAKLRHIKQINDRLRLGLKVSLVAI